MPERAAADICVNRHLIQVEELVQGVDCGIRRFAVDRWDRGVFEALDEIIDGGGRHGGEGGGRTNYQLKIKR